MNMINNAILKMGNSVHCLSDLTGKNDTSSGVIIKPSYYGFPSEFNIHFEYNDGIYVVLSVILGFAFRYPAVITLHLIISIGMLIKDIVREKQFKIKLQFHMLSVSPQIYWLAHFIADFLQLISSMVLVFIVLACFNVISMWDCIDYCRKNLIWASTSLACLSYRPCSF